VGSIDFVLVRHRPLLAQVEDFVPVEVQSDSTTSTGALVSAFADFMAGQDIQARRYAFGINTYDTIKRALTQLLNKAVVYEAWQIKNYWVMQTYIYENLVRRYGFKTEGFDVADSTRLMLFELMPNQPQHLSLQLENVVSTSVSEVFTAIRHNPNAPAKDVFVSTLNNKLRKIEGLE